MISNRKLELWAGSNRRRRDRAAATCTSEECILLLNLCRSSLMPAGTAEGDESDKGRAASSSDRKRKTTGAFMVPDAKPGAATFLLRSLDGRLVKETSPLQEGTNCRKNRNSICLFICFNQQKYPKLHAKFYIQTYYLIK